MEASEQWFLLGVGRTGRSSVPAAVMLRWLPEKYANLRELRWSRYLKNTGRCYHYQKCEKLLVTFHTLCISSRDCRLGKKRMYCLCYSFKQGFVAVLPLATCPTFFCTLGRKALSDLWKARSFRWPTCSCLS